MPLPCLNAIIYNTGTGMPFFPIGLVSRPLMAVATAAVPCMTIQNRKGIRHKTKGTVEKTPCLSIENAVV